MANQLYDKGREYFLQAWLNNPVRAVLVDASAYTPNPATDDFLNDIPVGARIATSNLLTNKTATNGVADADDPVFPAGYPMPAPTGEMVIFYFDMGSDATNRLIAIVDNTTGLPITPNGADFVAQLNDGPNKLFKL